LLNASLGVTAIVSAGPPRLIGVLISKPSRAAATVNDLLAASGEGMISAEVGPISTGVSSSSGVSLGSGKPGPKTEVWITHFAV
jgi:hypothetical protein